MKILHLNAGNLFGGVESLLLTVGRHGHRAVAEHLFAVCFEGKFSQCLRAEGQRVFRLPEARSSRPWSVYRSRRALRSLLAKQTFDVVVCHMPWSLALFGSVCQQAGVALVFWAHDIHRGDHWLERWAARRRPDLHLVNSQFTAVGLARLFPQARPAIVHCPVELVPSIAPETRAAIREASGVRPDQTVIIQVSRMEPWKGQHLHLQALGLLAHRRDWVCWMVGGAQRPQEKEYLDELRGSTQRLGIYDRVHFLGQRSDVRQLLASADLYCQPNAAPEPFGISFVEALGAGLPVLSFAMGGVTEIVTSDCGTLVQPGDVGALADAIAGLLSSPDLRAEMGSRGPVRAQECFDPMRQLRLLDQLWIEAVRRRDRQHLSLDSRRHAV